MIGFSLLVGILKHVVEILYLEHAFQDTSQWTGLRVAKNLPGFLESNCSTSQDHRDLKAASKAFGTPHTLVVTSSAMRAADLTRFVVCSSVDMNVD